MENQNVAHRKFRTSRAKNRLLVASSMFKVLNLPVPIPDEEKKIKLNFYFHTSLWCLKRFMKAFFIKTSEAPQRSVKIKI